MSTPSPLIAFPILPWRADLGDRDLQFALELIWESRLPLVVSYRHNG